MSEDRETIKYLGGMFVELSVALGVKASVLWGALAFVKGAVDYAYTASSTVGVERDEELFEQEWQRWEHEGWNYNRERLHKRGIHTMSDATADEQRIRNYIERDYGIPEYMHGGIIRYIFDHVPPGDFLQGILRNDDVRSVCERADDKNQSLIFEYVKFFHNHAPMESWGSKENYERWIHKHET